MTENTNLGKEIMSFEEEDTAKRYDNMIPWDSRLAKEIPLIEQIFLSVQNSENNKILDLACSTGRHSFALEERGFTTVGMDFSGPMIIMANKLKEKKSSKCNFFERDLTLPDLKDFLAGKGENGKYASALMLGNAIANMGSFEGVKQMFQNTYDLLIDGGKFFMQIIQRPVSTHYVALRKMNDNYAQRLMVPVSGQPHNIELNFNVMGEIEGKLGYLEQSVSKLYLFSSEEFLKLTEEIGFKISDKYSSYSKEAYVEESGKSTLFVLEK